MGKFSILDTLRNIINSLVNSRNAITQNKMVSSRVGNDQLKAIYISGIGSKIVRLKAGYALKDTIQFATEKDEEIFKARFQKAVKAAARYMIGFGRGIIVLYNQGDDLSMPVSAPFDPMTVKLKVFSGDMVTGISPSLDLMNERYYKPVYYSVRGVRFHYSRVIDFTYFEPPEDMAPTYDYGGISEFELIYNQLINDGVVERCTPTILEKNSTLFYRVEGFKAAMQDQRDTDIIRYFQEVENGRSIYGAGLLDKDDEVLSVTQALSNLQEADTITLRRLALVTGIPMAILIGENVKGLNSTGENEMLVFQEMIETVQSEYLEEPINRLLGLCGMERVEFSINQGRSPDTQIEFESKAIQNAQILYQLGEDHEKYLIEKDVIAKDDYQSFFFPEEMEEPEEEPTPTFKELNAQLETNQEN